MGGLMCFDKAPRPRNCHNIGKVSQQHELYTGPTV